MVKIRYTIYNVESHRKKPMKDYADRSWATNDKRENSQGSWIAFGILMVLLVIGSSDIVERLLS
jgi:hypothetical protein